MIPFGQRTVVALRPWSSEALTRSAGDEKKRLQYLAVPSLLRSGYTTEPGIVQMIESINWIGDLQALHLFDCRLMNDEEHALGFHSFANLESLKIEACSIGLRSGLPTSLRSLLVYGGETSDWTIRVDEESITSS